MRFTSPPSHPRTIIRSMFTPSHVLTIFKGAGTKRRLIAVLALGLLLRIALLLFFWDQPLTIVDEQHYQAIAENILYQGEFSLHTGKPTAIRPPFYPFFLSGVYALTGGVHYNAVRIVQILLSLGIIYMTFLLGRKVFNDDVGLLAALIFAIYPSFLFFTHLLLTEVLFTLLLMLFVYFFLSLVGFGPKSDYHADSDCPRSHLLTFSASSSARSAPCALPFALLSGLFLALGALTRSILYPFAPIAVLFLVIFMRRSWVVRAQSALVFLLTFIAILAPWTLRNYKLFNAFVPVDTMGGLNLHMGNYLHTPLNRAWAAVDLTGEKAWYYGHELELQGLNEVQKEGWAKGKAKEFMLHNKLLTLKRGLVKAANFWGLERTIIGGIMAGQWPDFKKAPVLVLITGAIFFCYILVVIGCDIGAGYSLSIKRPEVLFIVLIVFYFTGLHAVVFGHSRYHLPLMPLAGIGAAWAIFNWRTVWQQRRSLRFRVSAAIGAVFFTIWLREIILVEGSRYVRGL